MSITTDLLGPLSPDTMRVIFLYVGQGESTLVLMPNGAGGHLSMLIDCNRGAALKGIDLAKMLTDVLPKNNARQPVLDVFANTHPHSDHLGGLDEIRKAVQVQAVWHSGHTPGDKHAGAYADLTALLREVGGRGGIRKKFEGSRTPETWGMGKVHILSPADYITDEIDDLDPDERDARIHDQCAVLRIGYGAGESTRVLITGDSDKQAWIRITDYHGKPEENRVKSNVLSASHHGSYTFFKDRDDDPEPYGAHLAAIAPQKVIISAPDRKDSKHQHPDPDALKRYEKAVGKDHVYHMGSRGWSFVVDAYADGTYHFDNDRGDLARAFAFDENRDDDGGKSGGRKFSIPAAISRVEKSRPMGSR